MGPNQTRWDLQDPHSDLTAIEKDWINKILEKDRKYKAHLSTERTSVTVPRNVRPMYERIDNRDAYMRKLENERHRLWKSICGLDESLKKRYDVGTAKQFEAYKRQYENVKGTHEYYLAERNA